MNAAKKLYDYIVGFGIIGAGALLLHAATDFRYGPNSKIGKITPQTVESKVEFYVPTPITSTVPQVQTEKIMGIEERLKVFADYTSSFEGRRSMVYDPNPQDGEFEPTIGVGHYLERKDSREVFARVLPSVDWNEVYERKTALTDSQIDTLFSEDLREHVERAKVLVPELDHFPLYVQTAIVDMAYRGDLLQSPIMRSKLNAGMIREAAIEYIDGSPEYKKAVARGMSGIKFRRESNQRRLLDYANALGQSTPGR